MNYAKVKNLLDAIEDLKDENTELVIRLEGPDYHFKINIDTIKLVNSKECYFPRSEEEYDEQKTYLQIGSI